MSWGSETARVHGLLRQPGELMATCPQCGGFLGEHHHCAVRRRARRVGMSALAMLVGMVVCTLTVYAVNDSPSAILVMFGVVGGMILGQAVWTAIPH
jgi:hypothetical protein